MNPGRIPQAARMMLALKPSGAGIAIGRGRELVARARYLARSETPMAVWTDEDHVAKVLALPEVEVFAPGVREVRPGVYRDGAGRVELHTHIPEPFDVARFAVVFLCDLEEDLSKRWYEHAHAQGKLVNDADIPHRCDFDVPALHCDGSVRVAISTAGQGPGLAGRLRKEIALTLPRQTGEAVRRFGGLRAWNKTPWGRPRLRRLARGASFQELANLDTGDELRARRTLSAVSTKGHVVLVGAGPGDPEMLTLAALRWLARADVVVADRLVAKAMREGLEDLTTAEWKVVNKPRGGATAGQRELEAWTVEAALSGKTVVRLKSGDCGFFARTGEELHCYRAQGINVQVVPGVSAIHASSAAAQIPLTWRGCADRVQVVTAVGRDDSEPVAPDYDPNTTLVILMGIKVLPELVERLIASGHPRTLSAALVEKVSSPGERVITGTLEDLPRLVREHGVTAPATIVVGEVVAIATAVPQGQHIARSVELSEASSLA